MERSNNLYGLTALFHKPDDIIHAADLVSGKGFNKFDVHTPYPLHGMDKAMRLKPSKLGFITLAFGLGGAAFVLMFMYWALSLDYPMIIGGKPFFSLPAFIPVTFEVTVLLATLSTVIGLLTFFFNYPDNNHPLQDTDYMKNVSLDKFGICILAEDPLFNLHEVKALLESAGGKKIAEVYYPEKDVYPVFQKKFLVILLITAVVVSAGTYFTLNKILYMPPFDFMMEQDKVIPQERSDYFSDEYGMRQPVKGTVARGFIPYPFMGQPAPVEVLSNPLLLTKENIQLGQRKFNTFCSPCHGNFGDGDSRLRGQFPNPPTLHSTRARDMKDGMLYHIITNGQNAMPSYANQILSEERWAIVNYIRVLQRAKNAKQSDLLETKKDTINAEL